MDATMIDYETFSRLVPVSIMFVSSDGPVTKNALLASSGGSSDIAFRLFRVCLARGSLSPKAVVCSDEFEMPENRLFPELVHEPVTENTSATDAHHSPCLLGRSWRFAGAVG